MSAKPNIQEAIPFFWVRNIDASLKFYLEGLGFEMTHQWLHEGKIRWCRLQLGKAAIMLQEFWREGINTNYTEEKTGLGVSVCFICQDALAYYHEILERGVSASEPFVGNNMWVTGVADPDNYRLFFESLTEVPEETRYSEWENTR